MAESEFVIVGGGIIGLSLAWELARRDREVMVLEADQAGQGTTWLGAGMLAPSAEIGFEEWELYQLSSHSSMLWRGFADDLQRETSVDVDYRTDGTLMVADDRDAAEALRRVYDFQVSRGLDVQWLTGAEALEREPFLAPRLSGAVFAGTDHQADNRLLVKALLAALKRRGVPVREGCRIASVLPDPARPGAVTVDGERVVGRRVIVAAGVWSGQIEGLAPFAPPVRPVKGQMIELLAEPPFDLRHVIRGPSAYMAPKSDGRLLLGATSEEMGFDTSITGGGLYKLLEGGWEIVPGILDLKVTDTWAGLRPASRDHKPILGPSGHPGIDYATGHYRHGIILAPITARLMADYLIGGETPEEMQPFLPQRFFS